MGLLTRRSVTGDSLPVLIIIIMIYLRTYKLQNLITKSQFKNISTIDHFAFEFKDKAKKFKWFYLGPFPVKILHKNIY